LTLCPTISAGLFQALEDQLIPLLKSIILQRSSNTEAAVQQQQHKTNSTQHSIVHQQVITQCYKSKNSIKSFSKVNPAVMKNKKYLNI